MLNSKKGRALLVIAIVCGIGGIWFLSHDTRTTYKGRSLDHWLDNGSEAELKEAVHAIGTNAIPRLLKLLQADHKSISHKIHREVAEAAYAANIQVAIPFEPAYDKWAKAEKGFAALGTNAWPAVPILSNWLVRGEFPQAASGLFAIGEAGVPALLSASQSENEDIRRAVAGIAAGAGFGDTNMTVNDRRLIQALVAMTQDQEHLVRAFAVLSLAGATSAPDLVIPALTTGLNDPQKDVRRCSARSLGYFGPLATNAVPRLQEMTLETNSGASSAALEALRRIQSVSDGSPIPRQ